jgi:voltage-gated potassium channel
MISLLLSLWMLVKSVARGAPDPVFRRILVAAVVLLASGTIAMFHIEGWSLIDSFYFSVITLTTVGFGDLTPQSDLGKLFTSLYVLGGIGVLAAFINALAERRMSRSLPRRRASSKSDSDGPVTAPGR